MDRNLTTKEHYDFRIQIVIFTLPLFFGNVLVSLRNATSEPQTLLFDDFDSSVRIPKRLLRKQQKLVFNYSRQSRLLEIRSKSIFPGQNTQKKTPLTFDGNSKRLIAISFLTLPDKTQHPEYYQSIGLPIALDTIEVGLPHLEP